VPDRPKPSPALQVLTARGGHLVFASDQLLAQVDALGVVSEQLRLSAGELLGLVERADVHPSIANGLPFAATEARRMMNAALRELMGAQSRASDIRHGVQTSLEVYAVAEKVAAGGLHAVGEQLAWGLGTEVRVLAIPLAVFALEGLGVGLFLGRSPARIGAAFQDAIREHERFLTNPVAVEVIRETASDADGFSAGLAGLPPGAATGLEAAGVTGVTTSAAQVITAGNLAGLLLETPVSVRKTSSFAFGRPARSITDRSKSFPNAHDDPNGEQIRIDRYVEPGKPDRFDVFVSGTVTFDPKTRAEPFDFTSDLSGVAAQSPGSVRAVEQAMAAAGVTPASPVILNGYSQGGLVAAMVAASGNYNVKGVVTFGAPSAQVHLPASVPVLTVRNTEDLVPATSGYDSDPSAVVVQRSVFADRPVPTDWAVPAHRLGYYQQTAALVDQAQSSQVRSVRDPIIAFSDGVQRVDSTLWVATRTEGMAAPTPTTSGASSMGREAGAG
jgi:hypothetical protein